MSSPSAISPTKRPSTKPTSIEHYENFPVASWLCPPALRPAIASIYHFARTADDLADEGDHTAEQRLDDLAEYRRDLEGALSGRPASKRWAGLFQALAITARKHQLPANLLRDLLSAFEQDVRYTAKQHAYRDLNELLAYCRLSANPIGRLLLHLYGITDKTALAQSDHICSALQLINFWQDISVDLPRQRHYLPQHNLAQLGLTLADFQASSSADKGTDARRMKLVATLCHDARARMHAGIPLVHTIPGRAGWELRLVVQGGLRILDKIESQRFRSWERRSTIGKLDAPRLLLRTLGMRPAQATGRPGDSGRK